VAHLEQGRREGEHTEARQAPQRGHRALRGEYLLHVVFVELTGHQVASHMRTRESLNEIMGQMHEFTLGQEKMLKMQTSAEEQGVLNRTKLSLFFG
jgi:uncharacterized cupredoxin-like copper-binding protein